MYTFTDGCQKLGSVSGPLLVCSLPAVTQTCKPDTSRLFQTNSCQRTQRSQSQLTSRHRQKQNGQRECGEQLYSCVHLITL